MLIDGEKYACEACVRGHRVSNCQHHDRQLHHINKKGRPVSQCSHCRTLRKSRSAHVKCDCGNRSHGKGHCSHKGDKDHGPCNCNHGGRCTCSLKKEHHLSTVPELSKATSPNGKPRLSSAQSESSLTHFANGVHKPGNKYSQLGHKCATPYAIPRSHTISGYGVPTQRTSNSPSSAPRSRSPHNTSQLRDSFMRTQQDVRLVRSEHGSPHTSAVSHLDPLDPQIQALDLPYPAYSSATGNRPPPLDISSVSAPPPLDHFVSTPDTDQPMYSADLNGPAIDWSTFDLPVEGSNGLPPTPYSQPHSYSGYDFHPAFLSHRAMTAPSTGDASEVEEFPVFDPSPVHPPSLVHTHFPSDSSEVGDSEPYRLNNHPSYMGSAMLTTNNLQSLEIVDFMKGSNHAQFDSRSVGGESVGAQSNHGAFEVHKFAPTSAPAGQTSFTMPVTSAESSAPYWVNRYGTVSASLSPENDTQEAVWTN